MNERFFYLLTLVVCALSGCASNGLTPTDVAAAVRTAQVSDDPDDPAIWIHLTDAAASLIIGTNKVQAPNGALVVFGLDGAVRQTVAGLDRPNNVDIEYGLKLGEGTIDVAVTTERLKSQLRVFRIAPDGSGIPDVTAIAARG
jgi:3-phytase